VNYKWFRYLVVVAAAAIGLGGAQSGLADRTVVSEWSAQAYLSPLANIVSTQLAMDAKGDAVAAWTQNASVGSPESLVVSVHQRDEVGWSRPFVIWRDKKRALFDDNSFDLAVSPAGHAVVYFGGDPVGTRRTCTRPSET
jgi:hypothetical protein